MRLPLHLRSLRLVLYAYVPYAYVPYEADEIPVTIYFTHMNLKLQIDSARLEQHLIELAQIGARTDGGVCRLAFSDADLEGRAYVEDVLSEAGLEIRIDPVGNLFAILRGTSTLPAIMIGSHTDTVATGGRYDGALGVLAAVECALRIKESGWVPNRSIVVASFVNEEGVRFMPDMMGSLYHSGQISLDAVAAATDLNGVSIGQELTRLQGYAGTETLEDIDVGYFLELHIEQGPVLEDEDLDIGVVTGVQGLSWTEVTVHGASNHAGTTPMERRRDAGLVSGELMSNLRQLPNEIEGLRLTIGSVTYHPNLINVIASKVQFTVDIRHPDSARLQDAEARVKRLLTEQSVCQITCKSLARVEPCTFSEQVVSAVQNASDTSGYSSKQMISGAGHDAQILNSKFRSGMIFIPSRGGISHNIEEYSSLKQVVAGANVLLGAVQHLTEK
jgi:beta-ureidopropionase / N-carbamoyl-L-amino-acid hydrolase